MRIARLALPLAVLLSGGAVSGAASAADTGYPLEAANVALSSLGALQRGARYFVNYCISCHSAQYSRYERIGEDLGLTEEQVRENLIFTRQKIGELLVVSFQKENALEWFGAVPMDLTLIARARGADWLYTYLKSFYLDETRPTGVNNALFHNVSMPHVLWELQGWQEPVYKTAKDASGEEKQVLAGMKLVKPGSMSEQQYDDMLHDLVSFMVYLSEPIAANRKAMGIWVLLFFLAFGGIAYALKKEYWRDIDSSGEDH